MTVWLDKPREAIVMENANMYRLRTSLRDDEGQEYERTLLKGYVFEQYADARQGCVEPFRAIAQVASMLHDHLELELWFEIVDERYGAVSWEMKAEDCSTLTALPF